ncbi:MAG: SecY family transport protein [Fusobacteria bacterium]|nr:SecY family transport protein [Fusobacteriota bacterium]
MYSFLNEGYQPNNIMVLKSFLSQLATPTSVWYLILEFLIVVFFSYFYTAIVFDPGKVADNLKQSGGAIPGIRPGQETELYLERVAIRITTVGALFLGIVSILPSVLSIVIGVQIYITGISLLIIVGVAVDFVQQINANLVMRDYDGFIK